VYVQGFGWKARREETTGEDLGVGRKITLRWTLGRQESMGQTGFGWLRIGSSGGFL
jgi:hypothetical protein